MATMGRGLNRDKCQQISVLLPLFWTTAAAAAVLVVVLGFGPGVGVEGVLTTTNETMVVAKTLLTGPCLDNTSTEVGDGAEWSTGCNKVACHVEPSGNYTITHGCRTLVPSENPDSTNCITVVNSAAAYPNCCPYLQCGSAALPSTINPSLCYDISSQNTCQIWKELSSNCTDTSAFVYNYTIIYCRLTCGFCPGGSG